MGMDFAQECKAYPVANRRKRKLRDECNNRRPRPTGVGWAFGER